MTSRVLDVVAAALERSLRPGETVLVACSGGPDSSTLLDAMNALGRNPLHVSCVDHGLRAESQTEAQAVVARATSLGLPSSILEVTVEKRSMAAARQARYHALVAEAGRVGAAAIAVAHTATDQAETLLDRLVRGAGTRGLAAMARVRPIAPGLSLVRPLLDVTAAEVEAWVAARGLEVVRDPTNRDPAYRRSRIRHEVLPLLRRERADLDRALVALCDRLRADAEALDAEADRQLRALDGDGGLDARALDDLPDAIAARVIARAAQVPLEAVHVEAVRRLCADARGTRSISLPGGVVAERRYDRLRFGAPAEDPGDVEIVVTGEGRYTFLGMEVVIQRETVERAGPLLRLRNFRAGDQLGSRKLKSWFIDRKIPRPERRRIPLLAVGQNVLEVCALTGERRVQ
jgi:tRNA(Ile)-lysidine synthetase-like protein